MATETTIEKRLRRLEELILAILGKIAGILHKLGQVAEDNARAAQPLPNLVGVRRHFAQADGDISAAVDNTFGSGNAFLLQKIVLDRHQFDPERSVAVVNSTTGAIDDKTYLELIESGGVYSVVVANCAPAAAKAPPPPE